LRIEVHPELVGMVHVAAPDRPGIQVEAAEIHRPDQMRDVHRQSSRALRPLGNVTVTVSIHSGSGLGTRFW
jgi:hypothetical protein